MQISQPLRMALGGLFFQYPFQGVGRYTQRLYERFSAMQELQLTAIACEPLGERGHTGRPAGMVLAPRAPVTLGARVPERFFPFWQRCYWEQVGLPLALQRLRPDVLFMPHHALPLVLPCPSVVTIHDLIPLQEPLYGGTAAGRLYFRLLCRSARLATAIVTDSAASQRSVVLQLGIPASRVHVIPLGVEPRFHARPDPEGDAAARGRLELPERYLVYVGGADVRKNIGVLLGAMALLRQRGELGDAAPGVPTLVVAAPSQHIGLPALYPDWRGQARELGLGDAVRFVDRIAEADLPAVYRGAVAFCFPSRLEGFGLTPLEAMACGAPVLCSDQSSLPEVVGDAGILLPPDEPAAWADAIARVAGDDQLRRTLSAAGVSRAAAFTWERTAQATLAVIRSVARGPG